MSEATLTNLLEYLYDTLTPSNMQWLGEHLIEYAQSDRENLKPYTVEELLERAEEGRRQIALGNYVTSEEMFRDLFKEFGLDPDEMKKIEDQVEKTNLQYAEAV